MHHYLISNHTSKFGLSDGPFLDYAQVDILATHFDTLHPVRTMEGEANPAPPNGSNPVAVNFN